MTATVCVAERERATKSDSNGDIIGGQREWCQQQLQQYFCCFNCFTSTNFYKPTSNNNNSSCSRRQTSAAETFLSILRL